jgi:nicotinamidase/pyrazinamidase
VIDVQDCVLPGFSLAVKDGDKIGPVMNRLAKGFVNVVMTQDWHTVGACLQPYRHEAVRDHRSQLRQTGAVARSLRAGFRRRRAGQGSVDPANRTDHPQRHNDVDSYAAFTEADGPTTTGRARYLKARGLQKVFVAGLATDFCVAWLAIDAR